MGGRIPRTSYKACTAFDCSAFEEALCHVTILFQNIQPYLVKEIISENTIHSLGRKNVKNSDPLQHTFFVGERGLITYIHFGHIYV